MTEMTVGPRTRLRADARRNRDQIIAAAKLVFAAHGPDVPMEQIARQAGVGVGTLYRRFPDRAALIRAVAQDSFATVLAEARAALADEPTAWQALARLAHRSRELQVNVQLELLSPRARQIMDDDPVTTQHRRDTLDALEAIVRAAHAENSLRPDVGTGDVVVLFSLLLRHIPTITADTSTTVVDRAVILILDGLAAQPGTLLPGQPVTRQDIDPD